MNDMKRVTDFLHSVAKMDPVPCNGCTACCRGNTTVQLRPDFGDDISKYHPDNLARQQLGPGEPYSIILKRQENGDCIYLRGGKCVIYENRPAVCWSFDCRRAFYQIPEHMHDAMVVQKVFGQEILDAYRERKDTLKLHPLEKQIYDGARDAGLADMLIGRQNG